MSISTASKRKYRIGIDARFFRKETAGVGRYTRELLHRLAYLDTYNSYFVFLTKADLDEWDITQANFYPVVVDATHYTLREQTTFLSILYRYKLDLVHFLSFNHPLLYRRPFITTIHDLTLFFFPAGKSKNSRIRALAFAATMRHAVHGARKVIAISEHTAHDAEKFLMLPHAKMEVIYQGSPQISELPFGNKAMAQDYLGSRQPYFIFISSWYPHKGLLTLVEAFTLFKKATGLPHQLALLGNNRPANAELKEAITNSQYASDILIPGFAPDELLPYLLRNAVAYIQPSEYEGFGLTVLEAFAYGVPVISSDNSALPEVAGKAALYFPTKDAHALAERMQEIVVGETLGKDLVEKGYLQLRKFSWDTTAQKTHDVYLKVLEKN